MSPDANAAENTMYAILRLWVMGVSDLPGAKVIFDRPGAPRPVLPYAMLNMITAQRIREMGCVLYEDTVVEGTNRVMERRAQDWEWTFSINLYGDGAVDHCRLLVNSLRSGLVRMDHLVPDSGNPLAVREISSVRRIPDLVENVWEPRAQFDLTVGGTVLDGFLVDVVETGVVTFVDSLGETDVQYNRIT